MLVCSLIILACCNSAVMAPVSVIHPNYGLYDQLNMPSCNQRRRCSLRDSAIFGSAFWDGFTMAGLFTKLSPPGAVGLTTLLTDSSTTMDDIETAEEDNRRGYGYAMSGMLCGIFAGMACVGSYAYLVMHAHPAIAGLVPGTWVLAIIGDLVAKYLKRWTSIRRKGL